MLRLKDILEVMYDTLARNEVDPADAEYVHNAIDHMDYDREEIVFTHEGAVYAIKIVEIEPDRVL